MQSLIAWVRSLDTRKVAAVIVALSALETGIVTGDLPLTGAVPAIAIPFIVAWSKIFLYVNPFLVGGQNFTALKWPVDATSKSTPVK